MCKWNCEKLLIPDENKNAFVNRRFTKAFVIPPGFEPRSKEPESSILSIKLWDLRRAAKVAIIFLLRARSDKMITNKSGNILSHWRNSPTFDAIPARKNNFVWFQSQ